MKGFIYRFLRDEGGATAIEYGLICALIFLAIILAVTAFAAESSAMYNYISTTISAAIDGA
ncbi:Flp family type IVb pilin [Brevundimonas diminuta]|uniref:Flp family type IVb pilin n=1 Tax=Brevundimonas diminuta TaxID=293 RepID=UPI00320986EF